MGFFEDSAWKGHKDNRSLSTLPYCGKCGLYKQCKSPKMKPSGDGIRRVLFVAEAPDETEDGKGSHLIGDAGQCLRDMLNDLNVELDDCLKTNAVICHPPANKIEDIHIECCKPNLTNTIRELKPSVIILLGLSAVKGLLADEWNEGMGRLGALGRWIGWQIPSQLHDAWICPSYHPSYIIRSRRDQTLTKIAKQHLRAAMRLEGQPVPKWSVDALKAKVEIITDIRQGAKRIAELAERDGLLAFDYETTGLKPERKEQRIHSASFCHNGEDTFSTLVDETSHAAISRVLLNDRLLKIASNAKFEERWSRRKLGHGVKGWHHDTMLAAHVIDNRAGISSIKFQTFIHFGIGDYSTAIKPYLESDKRAGANAMNQIDKAPVRDLLMYGGLDSLLEYMVAEKQKGLMA